MDLTAIVKIEQVNKQITGNTSYVTDYTRLVA